MRQSEGSPKRSIMSKASKLFALSCELVSMFMVAQLVCIEAARTDDQYRLATTSGRSQTGNPKISLRQHAANFYDQIVWDERSLYNQHLPTSRLTRHKRASSTKQAQQSQEPPPLVDACQSKMEVLTPYYAANSKGKIRVVVNSELMQQAIQVETCVRSNSNRNNYQSDAASKCSSQMGCGCEQKYKWHRLLVMEHPNESAERGGPNKSLFMDWFLFPSSCVCRCRTTLTSLFLPQAPRSALAPTKSQQLPRPGANV